MIVGNHGKLTPARARRESIAPVVRDGALGEDQSPMRFPRLGDATSAAAGPRNVRLEHRIIQRDGNKNCSLHPPEARTGGVLRKNE